MRAGDLLSDLGQRRIVRPHVLEPVFRNRDGMRAPVPLAHEARTWLEAEARRGGNPTCCPQGFRQRLQLATRRLAEPAVRDLLKSVTERQDKEVAADPRRLTVVEPPPFAA